MIGWLESFCTTLHRISGPATQSHELMGSRAGEREGQV